MKVRLCSGCVVSRMKKGRQQILLVKSNSGGWTIPKGGIEYQLSPEENAIKEVFEEAGAIGHITSLMGAYRFEKEGRPNHVSVYFMKSVFTTKHYPERKLRKRKWFDVNDAIKKMPAPVVTMLTSFVD